MDVDAKKLMQTLMFPSDKTIVVSLVEVGIGLRNKTLWFRFYQ